MSLSNDELPEFNLEWSPMLHWSEDDVFDDDLNDTLIQLSMLIPPENPVHEPENSTVSLPYSLPATDFTAPSLSNTQTGHATIPSVSDDNNVTPDNAIPPEFDPTLISMSENDIYEFIDGQQNHNTMKKTLRDVALVTKFLRWKKEERDIQLIPPNELDPLLANFLLTVRKKDGGDFEPSTLRSIISSVDRKLELLQQ